MHPDNVQIDNSQNMVNMIDLFARYFLGSYSQLLPNTPTNIKSFNPSISLCNINITLSNIFQELDT
jgi:hypothetical protein